MAALITLPQAHSSRKSPINRSGVLTLYGYGIKVRMQAGHLEIEDGIGPERRKIRLARVGHGLQRLVVIGADGFVSLEALRWLADQDAAFVMLDRDGTVLVSTGPVRSSDARLRRAQALAFHTGAALHITRELLSKKLGGQEQVARYKLLDPETADIIAEFRDRIRTAETIDAIRYLESQGAVAYWAAWRNLPINFPKSDLPRVPDHWRRFDTRKSPLTGSQRLAANPANAMLNFLYAILESETRLAVATLGLDPGLGFWHVDAPARDSLACDLMEPARPNVDGFFLNWVTREPLKRSWFSEQSDGNCRLTSSLAIELSQTASLWGRAVAPFAEWVARSLWSNSRKSSRELPPPTRLTQRHKREAKGAPSFPPLERTPRLKTLCHSCGELIRAGRTHCGQCAIEGSTQRLKDAAQLGRVVARCPEARAKHAGTSRRQALACSAWDASTQPAWLTAEFYVEKILPRLAKVPRSTIASRIGVSRWYAGRIRQGYRPHPRHWQVLAELIGAASDDVCLGGIPNSANFPFRIRNNTKFTIDKIAV
jgi:CRISPR-associated endonuclease Cas1